MQPHFIPAGDASFYIYFEQRIDPQINARVRAIAYGLQASVASNAHLGADYKVPVGLNNVISTYSTIYVHYDPMRASFDDWVTFCQQQFEVWQATPQLASRLHRLPTCYGDEYGPDLQAVAAHHGIDSDTVVTQHSTQDYYIYFLGFTPGFPFLGGLPATLATPRLARPRMQVPAGSVGIAGGQTGVYPVASAGGWQLIGRTPIPLYQPTSVQPVLLTAGDYVRFEPISAEAFRQLEVKITSGQWSYASEPYAGNNNG